MQSRTGPERSGIIAKPPGRNIARPPSTSICRAARASRSRKDPPEYPPPFAQHGPMAAVRPSAATRNIKTSPAIVRRRNRASRPASTSAPHAGPMTEVAAQADAMTARDRLGDTGVLEAGQTEFRQRTGSGMGGRNWQAWLCGYAPPLEFRWPAYLSTALGPPLSCPAARDRRILQENSSGSKFLKEKFVTPRGLNSSRHAQNQADRLKAANTKRRR